MLNETIGLLLLGAFFWVAISGVGHLAVFVYKTWLLRRKKRGNVTAGWIRRNRRLVLAQFQIAHDVIMGRWSSVSHAKAFWRWWASMEQPICELARQGSVDEAQREAIEGYDVTEFERAKLRREQASIGWDFDVALVALLGEEKERR
jgi:hypothetical protein